ncbi:DNA repair protein [Hydrocarboniclastica marina]|uniref:DNA repair protein n=1 Tax=Hydrocarboniclastica marina TaxID=2259620 RepID=A0A4P7XFN3_9ALTE|nr:DNA repair protein [Hydrocarboniclastica marina]QCF25413.1 DNA repair protein [Hydrocarboniclastica marina]
MPSSRADDVYQVIFFMEEGRAQRAMRMSEFEAFLDGYAGLSDLADTEVKAIYAQVSGSLGVAGLVFFRIYFDDEGRADSSWNLPLADLLAQGSSGPDLGEGPIRLVCRSRCPEPQYRDALWDPDMAPEHNDFHIIRKAVEQNRMKLAVRKPAEPAEIPVLTQREPEQDTREQRVRLARMLRQQRLHIRTLRSAHRDATREIQREHRLELKALNRQNLLVEQQLERLKLVNTQLKARLSERNEQYLSLQGQIADTRAAPTDQQSQMELVLLREQLQRKEREADKRREQLEQLEAQIEQLQSRVPDEDTLLERLQEQTVMLVAYHAGVGHITLPYEEIGTYFDNPLAYAAARCSLNQPAYERWLAHYEKPECQASEGGEPCNEPILRISDPQDFRAGIDDRCERHRPAQAS